MQTVGRKQKTIIVITVVLAVLTILFLSYWFYFRKKIKYTMQDVYKIAAEYLAKYEGFAKKAMWDVNAWRIGFGSDTITNPDGTFRKVVQTDTTTREDALRDKERRLKNEFVPLAKNKIGTTTFNKWNPTVQAMFVSIAYNYGTIKKAIVDAAQTMDKNVLADVWVSSTYNDNKSLPENVRNALRKRRADEANNIRNS